MKDSNRHKGMRRRLVKQLQERGIDAPKVLEAILDIPRHLFLENAFEEHAYEDKAFPIDAEQTISQPYTVAFQSSLLALNKREKVLEIGTGSGYQACVLAYLGARLYTIERQEQLFKKAQNIFKLLGFEGIRSFYGDGYKGLGEFAPFDKILVTAAAPSVPDLLKQQLKIGGQLVIPVGSSSVQTMKRITRIGEKSFRDESFGDFRFVPMLDGKNPLKNI